MKRHLSRLLWIALLMLAAAWPWVAGRSLPVARLTGLHWAVASHRANPTVQVDLVEIFPSPNGWQALIRTNVGESCHLERLVARPGFLSWSVSGTSTGWVPCEGGYLTWGHGMMVSGPTSIRAHAGEVRHPQVARVTVRFPTGEVEATVGQQAWLLYEVGGDDLSGAIEIRAFDSAGNLLQMINEQNMFDA